MRRRSWTVATLGLLLVGALTGCAGRPAGVDGDLTNGWPALAQAKSAVPVAGVCYPQPWQPRWYGPFQTVDCATQPHDQETAYVGTFTGADAARSNPPAADTIAVLPAYTQCQQRANAYLGGDWHAALVELGLTLPSNPAWQGGARWFRCDLTQYTDPYDNTVVRDGSLKGNLTGSRSAAYGCMTATSKGDTVESATPVNCAKPHQAEFAGLYTAPNLPYPATAAAAQKLADNGCTEVVAKFLGFANFDAWNNDQVGWWQTGFSKSQWTIGDRTVQCFVYEFTKSGEMRGSVKGLRERTPAS